MQHFFVSKRFLINNYHQQKIRFESISQYNIKCNFCQKFDIKFQSPERRNCPCSDHRLEVLLPKNPFN